MKKIALWGAGAAGKYVLSNQSDVYSIRVIIDNHAHESEIMGIPIVTPQEYVANERNDVYGILIGISNEALVPEIIKQMSELELDNAGLFRHPISFHETLNWEEIIWFHPRGKAFLPYLETNIIDQCNLKCKGCSHFSNLFTEEDHDEETLEDLKRDLDVIAKNVFVRKLRILGGEPFLSPHLKEYVTVARGFLPDTDIRVVTNGTLLLQAGEELYKAIRENEIVLDISVYPHMREKKEAIKKYLDEMQVRYVFSPDVSEFLKRLDIKGNHAPLTSFNECSARICRFLRRGKLYTCPLEGILYKFAQVYQIDEFKALLPHMGLDVHKENMNWQDIYRKQAKPGVLCRFCVENGGEAFKWSVSANPKKEEWLVRGEDEKCN